MSKTYSGDKIVIKGKETGSLYPTNREETFKEILVEGVEEQFELQGGIFANNITLKGYGLIKGPVFARKDAEISPEGGVITMQSGITALNSLAIKETGKSGLKRRLSYSIDNLKTIIRGDILTEKKLILNDTIVIGSINAPDIKLTNCIVFGVIKNSRQLTIENCTIGIYVTNRLNLIGRNGFFIAGGKSIERPVYVINNEQEKPKIRFIPLCRLSGYGCAMGKELDGEETEEQVGLCCSLWVTGNCPYEEEVSLQQVDFAQLEIGGRKDWYLGIQGRTMTLSKIDEINKNFNRILHGIFAFDHLTNEDKEAERDKWEQVSSTEKKIYDIATR